MWKKYQKNPGGETFYRSNGPLSSRRYWEEKSSMCVEDVLGLERPKA